MLPVIRVSGEMEEEGGYTDLHGGLTGEGVFDLRTET
jgi:hypothetical protein